LAVLNCRKRKAGIKPSGGTRPIENWEPEGVENIAFGTAVRFKPQINSAAESRKKVKKGRDVTLKNPRVWGKRRHGCKELLSLWKRGGDGLYMRREW